MQLRRGWASGSLREAIAVWRRRDSPSQRHQRRQSQTKEIEADRNGGNRCHSIVSSSVQSAAHSFRERRLDQTESRHHRFVSGGREKRHHCQYGANKLQPSGISSWSAGNSYDLILMLFNIFWLIFYSLIFVTAFKCAYYTCQSIAHHRGWSNNLKLRRLLGKVPKLLV